MNEIVLRTLSGGLYLAVQAGATEIDVSHLLSALDIPAPAQDASTESFAPIPRVELPLSSGAQKAVEKMIALDVSETDVRLVRDILVAAKNQQDGRLRES